MINPHSRHSFYKKCSCERCGKEAEDLLKESEKLQERIDVVKAKLGSGSRFKAVEREAAKSGAANPAAVAAKAGMAKYGKAKMQKMAVAGKKAKQ